MKDKRGREKYYDKPGRPAVKYKSKVISFRVPEQSEKKIRELVEVILKSEREKLKKGL